MNENHHRGDELVVDFAGDVRVLTPGMEITFGRCADLVIDTNPNLHRLLGRLSWSSGMWWLSNVGSAIPMTLDDDDTTSFQRLGPGVIVPVSFERATIAVEVGSTTYEVHVAQHVELPLFGALTPPDEAEETKSPAEVPLTDEQRLLLVALAEHKLREAGSSTGMPTNRQVAARLGWTITKFNRKLDRLCRRYSAVVPGLRGDYSLLARDRRNRLVDYAVHAGIITWTDLDLLDDAGSQDVTV